MTSVLSFLVVGTSSLAVNSAWRERIRAQRHIRPHVNPLQRRFADAAPSLQPELHFASDGKPLHVDIGCGKGHFCADLATARPDLNVLGIEIREQLVDEGKRLVELMDGEIGVDSVEGEGSTFWFRLAFEPTDAAVADVESQVPAEVVAGARVLLADDAVANRPTAGELQRAVQDEGRAVRLVLNVHGERFGNQPARRVRVGSVGTAHPRPRAPRRSGEVPRSG